MASGMGDGLGGEVHRGQSGSIGKGVAGWGWRHRGDRGRGMGGGRRGEAGRSGGDGEGAGLVGRVNRGKKNILCSILIIKSWLDSDLS